MKKKGASNKQPNPSSKFTSHQSGPPITKQTFWFRLWLGFLIGANATFTLMTIVVLLSEKLRILMPVYQGITFIIVGVFDIWFMLRLLKGFRWALYATLAATFVNMLLNIFWGADLVSAILYALIPAAITLSFVIPQWKYYR